MSDALGLSLNDFRDSVYRPANLPGADTSGIPPEAKVNDIVNYLINLVLYASGSIAVLMLVIGGVMYVTSLGDQEHAEKAKKIIQYALIGLFTVILAYAAVTNVISLIYRATT
jgi:hypothetical protein